MNLLTEQQHLSYRCAGTCLKGVGLGRKDLKKVSLILNFENGIGILELEKSRLEGSGFNDFYA